MQRGSVGWPDQLAKIRNLTISDFKELTLPTQASGFSIEFEFIFQGNYADRGTGGHRFRPTDPQSHADRRTTSFALTPLYTLLILRKDNNV